jgi:hypothetical protein
MRTKATSTVMTNATHFGRRYEHGGDSVSMTERFGVHGDAVVVTVSPNPGQTGGRRGIS